MNRSLIRILLVTCVLWTVTIPIGPQPAAAHGTFETSDFQIRWPDRWHEVARSSTNIVLSDGVAQIYMIGFFDAATPESVLPDIVSDWFVQVPGEQIEEIPSASFADSTRAYSVYTYLFPSAGGKFDPYAVHFEARRLSPDLILWIVVDARWGVYNADPGFFVSALDTLNIGPFRSNGESHQTFVSADWRIAVATATLVDEHPGLGLAPQLDANWLIALVDITNWTSTPSSFEREGVLILSSSSPTQHHALPIPSQIVSQVLGLDDRVSDDLLLEPGESARIALVFQIPSDSSDIEIVVGNQGMSLDSVLEVGLQPSQLPPESQAPELIPASIIGLRGGSTLAVRTEEGNELEILILGVNIPGQGACYSRESMTRLLPIVGSQILLESEPAVLGDIFRYVWITNTDGSRTLLNELLLSQGDAKSIAIPEASRFNAWFEHAETTAETAATGIWNVC